MEISRQSAYLLYQRNRKPTIEIVSSFNSVLDKWDASSLVSPVWGLKEFNTHSLEEVKFTNKNYLFFIGPSHPEDLQSLVSHSIKVWLSIGLLNLVIATKNKRDKNRILKWLTAKKSCWEYWEVINGQIEDTQRHFFPSSNNIWKKDLIDLVKKNKKPELVVPLQEYSHLMATTISRSEKLFPQITDEIIKLNEVVEELLEKNSQYEALGDILSINAGLARFSSQTFTVVSSVIENDCHIKSHSLLGIGIANIGLWNVIVYIGNTLGSLRIPQRFAALSQVKLDDKEIREFLSSDSIWNERDYLSKVDIKSNNSSESLFPLLSFFSARDGFRSTSTTLSVPLVTLSAANVSRWSLMTITHEISHTIIEAILAEIIPDLHSSDKISLFLDEVKSPEGNLLAHIKRYFVFGLSALEGLDSRHSFHEKNLPRILAKWKLDIEEIMSHVFDLQYFYADLKTYVRGIWITWVTVPNLSSRVREYVIRTVCAAMSMNLQEPEPVEEKSIKDIYEILCELRDEKNPEEEDWEYISQAIKYIEDEEDEIKTKAYEMSVFVKITRYFLFSNTLATGLKSDSTKVAASRGRRGKDGYELRARKIEKKRIENPWQFIELYGMKTQPSFSESIWIFYVLAFYLYATSEKKNN